MIQERTFTQSWKHLLREDLKERNIYVEQNKIPLGTRKPYFHYPEKDGKRIIPDKDIIYLKYDPVDKPFTERSAFNILILGGSGDGKGLLIKLIWFFLHEAGYYCLYFDPKSADSGRAKLAWDNPRIPPNIEPKGIKLKHYLPIFATKNYEHLVHNFHIYSLMLHDIQEREMWTGLGCTNKGASKVSKIIKNAQEDITLRDINNELQVMYEDKELNSQALNSVESVIVDLEDFGVISENYDSIDLMKDWEKGNSICISYNSCSYIFMTFDIGMKIYQAVRTYFTKERRRPVMFFLDDSSYYAKEKTTILKYNFAINEIKNIGNNYRSLGLYNIMAVQSLGIVDENVSDTYKIKILTPSFSNPESLKDINIPKKVIEILQNNKLYREKDRYINEYVIIFPDNTWTRFFPFICPVNHFKEVYISK